MKRLIINADDFGLTYGVNRGIAESCVQGAVTSVTLMAVGRQWRDAVEVVRGTLDNLAVPVSVGCHVVLVDGSPVLPAASIPSLLNGGRGGPQFRDSFSSFTRGAMSGRLNADELEAEISSQIVRLQQAGLLLSHVDTHKHAHLFPSVLRSLIQALKKCGIKSLRNPFYPVRFPSLHQLRGRPRLVRRFVQVPLLRSYAKRFRAAVEANGLTAPDGCIGVYSSAFQSYAQMDEVLRRLPEGTWELVCHPGYNDAELNLINTSLRTSRETELEMLTSSQFHEMLRRHEITVCSYCDL
ncbi:ChbG/HpnK family deacetylase [Edaphobacter paludis]|uniref:ChbG/HpnK family deacetylase n=1 Tax=Edaphobacter paludis TaxID=3035702 RepID=A0AAU7D5B3_9BACT